jgi:hypothetical protein
MIEEGPVSQFFLMISQQLKSHKKHFNLSYFSADLFLWCFIKAVLPWQKASHLKKAW